MSKINKIRIMNLNYNRNTVRIDDETFHLNGESTLLSLRNGGGKTVLVQMVMSLFMDRSYRDLGDRKFESYFTTERPTFLMTEWRMDQDNGYFLAGMMVRKNQNADADDPLEMITFTAEYERACEFDIEHLPLLEIEHGRKLLKGFSTCKREFERLKRESDGRFEYYDMTEAYQRNNYFSRLAQHQIDHQEWETIIKKVNIRESGLSELFTNAKDEKGLIDKWILEAIENKINQTQNQIQNFQQLSYKLIEQYRKNQSNLKRKEVIRQYFQDAEQIDRELRAYQDEEERKQEQIEKIGNFILDVNETAQQLRLQHQDQTLQDQTLQAQMRRIECERYSYEIYQKQGEKADRMQDRIASEIMIQQEKMELDECERQLSLQECARIHQEKMDFVRTITDLETKRGILLTDQHYTMQERNELGGRLHFYYAQERVAYEQKIDAEQTMQKEWLVQQKDLLVEKQQELQNLEEQAEGIGNQRQKCECFTNLEQQFIQNYGEELQRNLLGEYEDGFLTMLHGKYEDERNENRRMRQQNQEEKKLLEEKKQKLQDQEKEILIHKWNLKNQKKEKDMRKDALQQKRQERMAILKYIGMRPEQIDDLEQIRAKLQNQILRLQVEGEQLQREMFEKQQEYDRLKCKRFVRLSKEMAEFLEKQDIPYMVGMEWFQKNGRSVKENEALAKQDPFLPYSLILRKREIDRLKSLDPKIYTDAPIVLIEREVLEERIVEHTDPVIDLGKVRFYVRFQEELLDEDALKEELKKKQSELAVLQERVRQKLLECREYEQKQENIEVQEFTSHLLLMAEQACAELEKEAQEIEEERIDHLQKMQECEIAISRNHSEMEQLYDRKVYLKEKGRQFELLCDAYEQYLEDRRTLQRLEKEQQEQRGLLERIDADEQQLKEQLYVIQSQITQDQYEEQKLQRKESLYASYQPVTLHLAPGELQIAEWTSRFEILTMGIGESLHAIEASLQIERERVLRKEQELKKKNIYGLTEAEYANETYLADAVDFLEQKKEAAKKRLNQATEENIHLEKQISTLDEKLNHLTERMLDKTGTKELVPKRQIVNIAFGERMENVRQQRVQLEAQKRKVSDKIHAFEHTQAAMAQYQEFAKGLGEKRKQKVLEMLEREELNEQQGALRKGYADCLEALEERRRNMIRVIQEIARKDCYKEEYFQKCFDNLLLLIQQVGLLTKQAQTNRASFETMQKKLELDLASIEKDRKNLEELFLEYVKEVDLQMHQIDQNSTIEIQRERVRMLELQVPNWDTNQEIYRLRVRDFVDSFLKQGMDQLDRNQNVLDTIGKAVTTKKLYDDVVGIRNIKVRLYKIEAERQVPISWTEVAANSGGEGFLSAFVILSCLLSYMRREDSDLLGHREEGKVLIMDNPFAQTYSEHLLRPLMEIAKKTNTQLICLSGIGGASIYNRFENIYVLNLVRSGLNQNLEYVTVKQVCKDETKEMTLSHFETRYQDLFEVERE